MKLKRHDFVPEMNLFQGYQSNFFVEVVVLDLTPITCALLAVVFKNKSLMRFYNYSFLDDMSIGADGVDTYHLVKACGRYK